MAIKKELKTKITPFAEEAQVPLGLLSPTAVNDGVSRSL